MRQFKDGPPPEAGFKADIYLLGRDPLHIWGMANRRRIEVDSSRGIWLAPPEYVILRKLEYYREGHSEKHLHDIAGMLEISGETINHKILNEWVGRLNLSTQWKMASNP